MGKPDDEPIHFVRDPLIGYLFPLPTRRPKAASTEQAPQSGRNREARPTRPRLVGWIGTVLRGLRNGPRSTGRRERAAQTALAEIEYVDDHAE